ncbi:glycosyltransferase family 39 protein [Actinoplanes subglobosus]|uniref:Glycosyltransferase family 39 protein n=1 Tax=Actinoplanes subglobosus TaxID=1547892 RepID=A0ABV8IP65_9ACTN
MTAVVDLPSPAAPAATPRPSRRLRPDRFFWLWPALTAGVIGGYQLPKAQLWRDELATLTAAGRSPGDMTRLAEHIDAVLTPYYWLMHVWISVFGDSVRALRSPSLLAVAATAALVSLLGARLFTVRAGVLGGLLFAVLPSVTRYGQEARPYALAALAATAATLMLVEALRHGRWWRWTLYALAVLALGGLHLVAVTLLTGHAVIVAYRAARTRSWRPLPPAALAVTAAVVALIPLALRGREQVTTQLGTKPHPPSWEGVLHIVEHVSGSTSIGGLLLGLCLLGVAADRRGRVAAAAIMVPIAAMVTVSTVTPIWHPRYLFFLVPLICVLAGAALARTPWPAGLVLVLVVALLGLPDQRVARTSHESRASRLIDYRAAARIIDRHREPGDAIVYKRDGWQFADIAVEYYLGPDTPRDALAVRDRDAAGSFWTPERTDVAAALARDTRVWVLVPDDVTGRRATLPQPTTTALTRDFTISGKWRVSGFDIQLLVRRQAR